MVLYFKKNITHLSDFTFTYREHDTSFQTTILVRYRRVDKSNRSSKLFINVLPFLTSELGCRSVL